MRHVGGGWVLRAALTAGLVCSCGMEVVEHRQELGVLKDQSRQGPEMERALAEQETAFRGVSEALKTGRLAEGARSKEVAGKYGRPVSVTPGVSGEQWMYRSRHGKRLQTPWIFLYFDPEGVLTEWKCARTDCG